MEYMFIVFSMFCCGCQESSVFKHWLQYPAPGIKKLVDAVITLLMLSLSHYNCSCFRMSKYSGCKSYLQDSNICQMLFLNNWSGSGVWRSPGAAARTNFTLSHLGQFSQTVFEFLQSQRSHSPGFVESAYKHFYI